MGERGCCAWIGQFVTDVAALRVYFLPDLFLPLGKGERHKMEYDR